MTRTDRRTLVRQLTSQGLSQRAIGQRLGVSKDTVARDQAANAAADERAAAPGDAPDDPDAPQVSDGNRAEGAPQDAPSDEGGCASVPDGAAPGAPVAQLPRRLALARLVITLHDRPALRRDLAVLERTGLSHEDLVAQAVSVLAAGYRRGIAERRIVPGPFIVRDMAVGPPLPGRADPRRPAPAAPAEGA